MEPSRSITDLDCASAEVDKLTEAEALLAVTKRRVEGILEIVEDAIISINSNQQIVIFSRGAQKTFGYTESEIIGRSIDLLFLERSSTDQSPTFGQFASIDGSHDPSAHRREVTGRRKDGSEFPVEASISKLDLADKTVFTIILRDITERKHATAAAEALRASERFARGQVNAFTRTVEALAMESETDGLVGHVLRTITDEFDAHSSSVWRRDHESGEVNFEVAFESGKLMTKSDARMVAVKPYLPIHEFWPSREDFLAGKPSALKDIRQVAPFPWRDHLLAQGIITVFCAPMLIAGQVEGITGIRFTRERTFRTEEIDLAKALANQAMLAMELTRLSEKSRRSAVMAERNRMAREVHDTLAQGFTGVIVQLEAAGEAMAQCLSDKASGHLERASELARESLREARRSVRALRPQALEENSLAMALGDLFVKMTLDTSVTAKLSVDGEPRTLPPEWENNLLRIGQEVLTNALRHAQATEFQGRLSFQSREVSLHLRDNGIGFDPAQRHEGFGLQGIRERAETMGGRLAILSAKGRGASISIVLPIDPKVKET